ncbi:MAG: hypothetical protein N4R58_04700 [Lactobacillus iners]|nr:hypothetical protein [Lactobacillus iners]
MVTNNKKVGRPKSTNPKNVQTRIRMTQEEAKKLEYCAKETGKTKTAILMIGLNKVYNDLLNK